MLEMWLKKYGALTALLTGVVIVTIFLSRLDSNSRTAGQDLAAMRTEMRTEMKGLSKEIKDLNDQLALYMADREKYERWNRQTNARIKRAFNRLGWEYEPIE